MKQWYRFVLYYLWIAPHVLLAIVPVVMFVRRKYRDYPVFFAYALFETLGFLIRFPVYIFGQGPRGLYRMVFLITAAGTTALRFGVIHEIFNSVFHAYPRLAGVGTISMRLITGILVVCGILLVLYSSTPVSDNLLSGIMLLDRSVAVIQAGMLLFLFLFSRMFGLSWRSFTFGIALGFGIFATTSLAYWAIRLTDLTEQGKDLLDLVPTGSYHISVVVWLVYLLAEEKPRDVSIHSIPELDQWSGELERSQ